MSLRKFTIKLPDERISLHKTKSGTYVYYRTKDYRNKNGPPTHNRTSIGKLDDMNPNLMYPNNNYFKFFPNQPDYKTFKTTDISDCRFISVGVNILLQLKADQLGLAHILKSIFPDIYDRILQIAFYMVSQGNIMMHLDDYYEEHHPIFKGKPAQKHLSPLYDAITRNERWEFFYQWQQQFSNKGAVSYDVTSISTHSRGIDFAELGYNRDYEKLTQINFGLLFEQESKLPLCYDLYNGSIPDISHVEKMIELAERLDIAPKLFAFDRRCLSQDNLAYLFDANIPFVMGVSSEQKIYKEAFLAHSSTVRKGVNYSSITNTYSIERNITVKDKPFKLNIYYNTQTASIEEKSIANQICTTETKLEKQLNQRERKKKAPYFELKTEKGQLISYEKDEEAIESISNSWDVWIDFSRNRFFG